MKKVKNINTSLKLGGMGGLFNCKKIDRRGRVVQETGPFQNLITDWGFEFMKKYDQTTSNQDLHVRLDHCVVGTGSATPSATDTELDVKYANTTSRNSRTITFSTDPVYVGSYYYHQYNVGFFSGQTITEVGRSHNGTNVVNRSLLPTPLTIDEDHGLVVESELRLYANILSTDSETITGSFLFDGSPITYTMNIVDWGWNASDHNIWTYDDYNILGTPLNPRISLDTGSGAPRACCGSWEGNWANSHSRDVTYDHGIREILTATWNPGNATGDNTRITIGARQYSSTYLSPLLWMDLDSPITASDLEEVNLTFLWEIKNL